MKNSNLNIVWCISLLIIGIATIILAGTNIIDIELSDTFTRVIGIIEIIALPVLVFTSIKKIKR